MKLMIESTDQHTTFEGVPVRIWNGTTENGVPCKVFVHRLAVHIDEDHAEFTRELQEQLPPATAFVPLSEIL